MIKHIVLFQMKKDVEPRVLETELATIKVRFGALLGIVPTLRSIEIGINCNPSESYNLSLEATFDDLEGLNAYAVHPDHQSVVKRVKAILNSRACVDYEI